MEPLIPLLDTTLLTNARGELRVSYQLLTAIHSADRIDGGEDAIAIMNEKPMSVIQPDHFPQLRQGPRCTGMSGHIQMQ